MSYANECLKAHNEYRLKHKAPPMTLDEEISRVAQNYADKLVKLNSLQHSSNDKYGENLYYYSSSNANYDLAGKARDAVDSWYNEIKDYRFGIDDFKSDTGHFTQVVWTDSVKLGVGVAKSGGKTIVVCNYFPRGNYMGQFKSKVPPVGGF